MLYKWKNYSPVVLLPCFYINVFKLLQISEKVKWERDGLLLVSTKKPCSKYLKHEPEKNKNRKCLNCHERGMKVYIYAIVTPTRKYYN